jgi:hypothetical protein
MLVTWSPTAETFFFHFHIIAVLFIFTSLRSCVCSVNSGDISGTSAVAQLCTYLRALQIKLGKLISLACAPSPLVPFFNWHYKTASVFYHGWEKPNRDLKLFIALHVDSGCRLCLCPNTYSSPCIVWYVEWLLMPTFAKPSESKGQKACEWLQSSTFFFSQGRTILASFVKIYDQVLGMHPSTLSPCC